jgi:hypothetical protein
MSQPQWKVRKSRHAFIVNDLSTLKWQRGTFLFVSTRKIGRSHLPLLTISRKRKRKRKRKRRRKRKLAGQ